MRVLSSVRRRAVESLPEPTLRTLLRIRHGETAPQQAMRLGTRESGGAVVHAFDSHAVRRGTVDLIAAALDTHGVPLVRVPAVVGPAESIAVAESDGAAALAALQAELDGPEWQVVLLGARPGRSARRRAPLGDVAALGGQGALVYRRLLSPAGDPLAGEDLGCFVDLWRRVREDDVARPDGGTHEVGTLIAPRPGPAVAYLTQSHWAAATAAQDHWSDRPRLPMLLSITEPVDIVYTWVDGSDPAWVARKDAHAEHPSLAEVNSTANHAARFESRDELRYSLRSLTMYANWARHVYLVTDDQVPDWLDRSNPRLTVVDHRDLFADPSVLPVFNSHAIESQLHRIDGLAEHYLYLNDDMFFGQPVTPETFFASNRISKLFLSTAVLDIDPPSSRDLPVMSAAKRNRALIEQDFGRTVVNKFRHTPYPMQRSVVEECEAAHPDLFAAVARSRFRHPHDYSIPSALLHYYAYAIGRAVPAGIKYHYQDISRPEVLRWMDNMLRSRAMADVFCINDTDTPPDHAAEMAVRMQRFLERYFPVPSEFELSPEDRQS